MQLALGLAGAAALVLASPWVWAASTGASDAVRREFRFAWDHPHAAPTDSQKLQAYLLYPDLLARRLEARIGTVENDAAVAGFLAAVADAPAAERLRRRWLRSLGERSAWTLYRQHYTSQTTDLLRCYALQAQLAQHRDAAADAALEQQALRVWLAPKSLPKACDAPFDWLQQRGQLTAERIEQRAVLALEAGEARLARYLARQLPKARGVPLLRRAQARLAPEAALQQFLAQPAQPYEAAVVQTAFARIALRDADAALRQLPGLSRRLHRQLPGSEAAAAVGQLHRHVAIPLAWSRRPEAVSEFRLVPEAQLDAAAQEWRVRAALWSGQWQQARQWLDLMPPKLAQDLRWRYWRARALEATGDTDGARVLYAELAGQRDYYGYLAADRAGLPYHVKDVSVASEPTLQAALANDPWIQRAHEWYLCKLRALAAADWIRGLATADPAHLQQAAILAHQWGWHERSIATLAQADHWDDLDLRYPLPYETEIISAARRAELAPEWVYAVIRQETLFQADAISSADARGLMQLQLPTARQMARQLRTEAPSARDLLDPDINISLGTQYLRTLLDQNQGRLVLALAAYNAGPGAKNRWLPTTSMDTDVWIENIPYNETRGYVQRVLEHATTYAWRRGREPVPRLRSIMGARIGDAEVAQYLPEPRG